MKARQSIMRQALPTWMVREIVAMHSRNEKPHCNICKESTVFFDIDHIVPYALVKHHSLDNLQVLCLDCHRQKTLDDCRAIRLAKTLGRTEALCWTCRRIVSTYFTHKCTISKDEF